MSTIFSGFFIFFQRYTNQNLLLRNFQLLKTGNLINAILFSLIIIFIFINIFSKADFKKFGLVSLHILSDIGIISLIVSHYIPEKDEKIIFASAFIILNIFILISLISISLSRSKKLHPFRSSWMTILIMTVGVFIVFLNVYNFTDDSKLYTEGIERADAGVILGAAVWGGNRPSPVLRERINKGFEIYKNKNVSKLVLTGGGSPNELTEAEVSRNELVKYGVDKDNLYIEKKSNSTVEQIHYIRDKLYKKLNWHKVVLISDNYHLFRASEICKFNNINVDCISSDTPLSTEGGINYCIKESFAVLFFWLFGIG